jgi:membrane protein YqaA with SNARE-associated domain
VILAFLWGFAEGTLFFVLPDVPLSLAAMFRPRCALRHIVAIVVGAVLGGALMFTWSEHGGSARNAVAHVPLVRPVMFEEVDHDFRQSGVWAAVRGPVRGIPYKIYAVEAPMHSTLMPFLVASVVARVWRLVLAWLGFAGAGIVLRKFGRGSFAPYLHAVFWIVVYGLYIAKVLKL